MEQLIAAITGGIVAAIANEADPAKREERIRTAVHAEIEKWASVDPGLASVRAAAIHAKHHVTPAKPDPTT